METSVVEIVQKGTAGGEYGDWTVTVSTWVLLEWVAEYAQA
jgi:hypothetical protein